MSDTPSSRIDIQMVTRRELDNDQRSGLSVEQARLMETFYRLETAVGNALLADVKAGDWNYIPFSHLMFYRKLQEAVAGKKVQDLRYLEYGCGLGTKLLIAHEWVGIGSVTGVEVVPTFAEIARHMLHGNVTILEVDLREFTDCHDYDIIYSYDPLHPPELETWLNKVKESMKPGAILMQGSFSRASVPFTTIKLWEKP